MKQFDGLARACTWISFGLLILTGLELVTSPLTQQVWTWDRFMHGGQDFESGFLVVLVSFCLLLVLALHCKRAIDVVLTESGWPACASKMAAVENGTRAGCAEGRTGARARNYRLPLTI